VLQVKTVIYCDPFVPPEWIAAHGIETQRIVPRASDSNSPVHVTFGICPYARAFINEAISQTEAQAVIFTTACDQMRRGTDIMTQNSQLPIFLMNIPTVWQRPCGAKLYAAELKRLGEFLVQLGGRKPTNAQLAEKMIEFENGRLMRPNEGKKSNGKVPLALVGGPLMKQDLSVFDLIEKYGGTIALDATTGGERTLPGRFNRQHLHDNPLGELVNAYFGTIPEVFFRPNEKLYTWLRKRLTETAVQGVIFHRYIWCDKWHAELGRLKEFTALPVLDLDAGDGDDNKEGSLQTRIQAFMEMLE
jgi:benzoyl-CoA reductase/2-hydroxyglutaryl-CoA dehydratase subunit BcrC/BadD/HgdB